MYNRQLNFEHVFRNKFGEVIKITNTIAQIEGAKNGFIDQIREDLEYANWDFVARREGTTIHDDNGKLIFEEDIVKCAKTYDDGGEIFIAIVRWHPKGYWYLYDPKGKPIHFLSNPDSVVIVGNTIEHHPGKFLRDSQ